MKKWLIIIIIFAGLLVALTYLFFPARADVSYVQAIDCNLVSIDRILLNENNWKKWWPGEVSYDAAINKNVFNYNGYKYQIKGNKYHAIELEAIADNLTVNETIFLIASGKKVDAAWKYSLQTNFNPISRIYLAFQTKRINKNIDGILKSMKTFFEKDENIYGLAIKQIQVTDTVLVSSRFSSAGYPTTQKIYEVIDSIKNYIDKNGGKETNFPMLNVAQDGAIFNTQVAIPVSASIAAKGNYAIKKMVPGKILVSEVKGGTATATEAMKQIGIYLSDNGLSSPAIPFESLITDRTKQPDTSKWITKIYYPIF